jgi:ribosomal protein S18 acetylase RimI-like enzyme
MRIAGYRVLMPLSLDPDTIRQLLMHESQVHALPRRDLRDLGDSIFLYDPTDPEPFWNRSVSVRWPSDPDAFDRRLTETLVMFAGLGRQPHIWPAPAHDEPPDLVERLMSNGFEDMGKGIMMLFVGGQNGASPSAASGPDDVAVERMKELPNHDAERVTPAIVDILADAFEVAAGRESGMREDTVWALGHPWFTYYLARIGDQPVAVARAATFSETTYLSSIGTATWARGRGLGRIVTQAALDDALKAGSARIHLGVFADNAPAIRLYEGLGFERIGDPVPDLLLV